MEPITPLCSCIFCTINTLVLHGVEGVSETAEVKKRDGQIDRPMDLGLNSVKLPQNVCCYYYFTKERKTDQKLLVQYSGSNLCFCLQVERALNVHSTQIKKKKLLMIVYAF